MEADFYSIRPAEPADVPFLRNSWARCSNDTQHKHYRPRIPESIYMTEHHRQAAEILSRAACLVACGADDPDVVLGYIVAERVNDRPVFHYVYVKHPFRRLGIAKDLFINISEIVGNGKGWCTHWAPVMDKWWSAGLELDYNPFRRY